MRAVDYAFKEYGVKEISGKEDNPRVLEYFDDLGFDGSALKDETSWCAAFVGWAIEKSGEESTKKLNARSYLIWGDEVFKPRFGDVVVFWRESEDSWKGHVGFYITERDGWTHVLGGNQGNMVKVSAYPTSRVLSYRRPKPITTIEEAA